MGGPQERSPMNSSTWISIGWRGIDQNSDMIDFARSSPIGDINMNRCTNIVMSQTPVTVLLKLMHHSIKPDPNTPVINGANGQPD